MRKFIKDQAKGVFFFYSQIILIICISQLAAYNTQHPMSLGTISYLILLPTCFLFLFLLLRYYKFRSYYQLNNKKTKTDISAWLPDAPNELLSIMNHHYEKQYTAYQKEIDNLLHKQADQLTFIQQWVHQVKTPLSVIRLILQKEKQHATFFSNLQSLEEEVDKIQNSVELVLYQSRLQKFDRDFYIEKVALNDLVKETIKTLKSNFIRRRVFPVVDIHPEIALYTDRKWLGFAINQIVSNALKYSTKTSNKIYLKSKRLENGGQLIIKDTGVGIPPQDLPRVFEPFYTGQNGRDFQESTGMGLFLVKQIVDALDHDIAISSVQGEGTSLTFTFHNLTKL